MFMYDEARFVGDAQQQLAFLTPQLYRINTEIDRTAYPSFDYSRLMFVNTEGDMWDVGSVFFSGDVAGKAEFLAGGGTDMPYADISAKQFMQANHFAGIGYRWNLQELNRAAKLNRNLGNDKADSARSVAEAFCYGMAIRGSAEKGTTGITNDPNVPTANVQADGAAGATMFASKDSAKVLRDINAIINAPFIATAETKRANTLLLPTSRRVALGSTMLPDSGGKTLLTFLREENDFTQETGQTLTVIGSRELETAGAGGTARMVAYANERDVVQFHLPGPHTFLPAHQQSSMIWEVAGIMNVGGVEIRRPKAVAYRDGI